MLEALRKLTADYTEAEYQEWIESEPRPVPEISENEHIKDIAAELTSVALDTGYEPEFLYQMFDEATAEHLEDGLSLGLAHKKAFDEVAGISYEFDW